MKTIDQAAMKFVDDCPFEQENWFVLEKAFEAGVEFAQQWNEIQFDKDGFVLDDCNVEIVNNCPVLLKDKNGDIELFKEITKEIKFEYKNWRSINIK